MSKFKKEAENFYGPLEEEPGIQGKLAIEDIVRRQMDRTATSRSISEELFEVNVRILMSDLPSNKLKELYEREDEYWTKEVDIRRTFCGKRMPSRNGEPETEKAIDFQKLYEMVMQAFEEVGLTWKIKNTTEEYGRVEAKPPPATPVFEDE